jgi:hypothetical protein
VGEDHGPWTVRFCKALSTVRRSATIVARLDGLIALQHEVAGAAYDDGAMRLWWLRQAELALEAGVV